MYLQDSSSQDVSLIATEAGREGERRQGGRERERGKRREGEREEERGREGEEEETGRKREGEREEERGREGEGEETGRKREGEREEERGMEGGRERERRQGRRKREERRETRSTTIVQPEGPTTWLLCRQSQRELGMIQLEGEPRFLQTATETNGLILFA